jgi:hypothetical protein
MVEDWRMVVLASVVGTVSVSWLVNIVLPVTEGDDTTLVEEVISSAVVVVASEPRVVVPSAFELCMVETF